MNDLKSLTLGFCLAVALSGPALAQSMLDPAATPGGTEGRAGPANEREAIKAGDAIPAPPSVGIPSDTLPAKSTKEEPKVHHREK